MSGRDHWDNIYIAKSPSDVSWFSPHLEKSLELILELGLPQSARILDVGGGASTLPDDLLARGFGDLTVLDISARALQVSKDRLAAQARKVKWIEADILSAPLESGRYDLWHDRAMFHFLTRPADREAYLRAAAGALRPGGYALVATFGPQGPTRCSDLETARYSPESLRLEWADGFELKQHSLQDHRTPRAAHQQFLYCLFQKR